MKKASLKHTRGLPGQTIPGRTVPAQPAPVQTIQRQPSGAVQSWVGFWFRPIDPVGLHLLRVLSGLLFVAWILPLFGQLDALFGLEGWFDQQAYREAARLPEEERPQFGWSILYLFGTTPLLLKATCVGAMAVLILFTLGIATRLTSVASWVIVVSFTANPALGYDADGLLVILAFYLMVGHVLLNQSQSGQTAAARWLGSRTSMASSFEGCPSVAANLALRLLQIHVAMAIVASGLHKLQFGDWWAGVALWYPLYPPLSTTIEDARSHMNHGIGLLTILSLSAYAMLGWQIAFPVFAWKPRWRLLLLGGASLGWLGNVWLYELPLFGTVLFIGCLSYLTPGEWQWIGARARAVGAVSTVLLPVVVLPLLHCSGCAPVGESPSGGPVNTAAPDQAQVEELPRATVALPKGLRQRIDAAIEQVEQREVQLNHGFWTVFHGLLGVGTDLKLVDAEAGSLVSAIDYISGGGQLRGLRFIPTPAGLDVQIGPMFVGQGHADQFVAEMLQTGLSPDHPFVVEGRQYTLMDFVNHTQSRVRVSGGQELSWSIIAIGQCIGTDLQWTNSYGEVLRFEHLVRYELEQSVEEAACGGTHRLFGLYWVYQLHLKNGGEATGVWQEIADRTIRYQNRARELQNPDGSFSTDFFRGRGHDHDMQKRINSTGHILEWLALSLPDSQLHADWVRDAANALSLMILEIRHSPMEGGTLYHAVHGLRLYRTRCGD